MAFCSSSPSTSSLLHSAATPQQQLKQLRKASRLATPRTRRSFIHASLQNPTSSKLPSDRDATSVPPQSIPGLDVEISGITDESALHMISRMRYTPIQTDLLPNPIHTCYVQSSSPSSPSSKNPMLLFLHGFDSNILEFRRLLPAFDAAPYDSHFVDVLGWGFTERPTSISYGPSSKRAHLQSYLHTHLQSGNNDGTVILIGCSIGGAIAADLYLNGTASVRGLVLIDAQVFIDKQKNALLQLPVFNFVANAGARTLRATWLRTSAAKLSYHTVPYQTDENIVRCGKLHVTCDNWMGATVDFIKGEGYCMSKRVSEIECPTLVLWGRHDRVLPKTHPDLFKRDLPHCDFRFIEGAGHSPHVEKSEVVAGHILDFVQSLSTIQPSNESEE